ncbi:hypothetical protein Tco_0169502 [Tanacetum coccineum]
MCSSIDDRMRRLRTQEVTDLVDRRREKERKNVWQEDPMLECWGTRSTTRYKVQGNVSYPIWVCFGEVLSEEGLCFMVVKIRDEDDEGRFNLRGISLTGFPAQGVRSSNADALDSPYLLVLITGTSQSRQHGNSESDSYYLSD